MKQPLREETKIAAALLRSKGYPELEIAHMLGISQGSVPKCLNWARKQQYLIVTPPEFVEARVSPDVLAKVRAIVEHDELRKLIATMSTLSRIGRNTVSPVVNGFSEW